MKTNLCLATASLPIQQIGRAPKNLGLELPPPSLSRAYFVGRLLTFDRPNQRGDEFTAASVSDDVIKSLAGAALVCNKTGTDHADADGSRITLGSILRAAKAKDGVYVLASVDRAVLRNRFDVESAEDLSKLALSMECVFDPLECVYEVDGARLSRQEALKQGIAAPDANLDRPSRYKARLLQPREFSRTALLKPGHQADSEAIILQAAASKKRDKPKSVFDFTEEPRNLKKEVSELRERVDQIETQKTARASEDVERKIGDRLSELYRWKNELDADELAEARAAAKGSELQWLDWKLSVFYPRALAEAKAAEAKASRNKIPPTLIGGSGKKDWFDFSADE